jgi:hypothetical protein
MPTNSAPTVDPMDIVRELAALPHRGATTNGERRAADILEQRLKQLGADVDRQPFLTPKTYVTEVWWLIGGMLVGLLLLPALPWPAFLLVAATAALALHYFDWRASPVSLLPPRKQSQNIIARLAGRGQAQNRLILMAHYDSAPVSMLYLPSMVKGFRQSLRLSLGLMVVAAVVALLHALDVAQPLMGWLRWLLAVYFLGQGLMASIDYLRFGFTNGAADNATGAAVAIATAQHLWRNPISGWEVEVVLTGAEEANLKGSRAYLLANRHKLDPEHSYLLNLDNLGVGQLRIITRTGSLTDVLYSNALVNAALQTAASEPRFESVKPGVWHTGDFDSLWFARAGIPSLTLSAQDSEGCIPNLHRPTDTLTNVDATLPGLAVDLAAATVQRLAENLKTGLAS